MRRGPRRRAGHVQRFIKVAGRDGEADLGRAGGGDVLDDHVDHDVCLGHFLEQRLHGRWLIGDAGHGHARLVSSERSARRAIAQPACIDIADDPGAWRVGERGPDVDRHAVFLGELNRAQCMTPAPRLASSSISS